jgi:hypothetical protein
MRSLLQLGRYTDFDCPPCARAAIGHAAAAPPRDEVASLYLI